MSNSVDNRIVQMKFNNKQFEDGVSTSMSSLEKLKSALAFKGSSQGLDDLQKSANKFNMDQAGQATEGFSAKMVAMATIGITALANITNRAVDAGIRMAKALTIEPVTQGFSEYELKMRSIQTILANTEKYGTTLSDVTKALDELNTYADKTIYNFAEMTRNVGLFTNAGMSLEDATAVIKGFSNEAAASGVQAEQAAAAAYQLSQGLNAGVIRLIDWKSLTNAGFGRRMQDGLITMATAMGTFNKNTTSAKAATDNFTGSLETGWLTADVMTNFLKISAGELTKEQQKSLGLTEKQIEEFSKMQKIGEEAATRVRTFTQFWTTLKESIASGWSETFEILIGNFETATTLFDRILAVINPIVAGFSESRNNLLRGWDEMGGRAMVIEGIANIFKTIAAIIKPIANAFKNLIPKPTAEGLTKVSAAFFMFTQRVREFVEGGADKLTGIFEVLGTVLNVLWRALKFVAGIGLRVFTGVGAALFEVLGYVGELASAFLDWAKPVERIEAFSEKISSVLTPALQMILKYVQLLAIGFILLIREGPEPFLAMLTYIGKQLSLDFDKIKDKLGALGQAFAGIIGKVKSFIESLSFGDSLSGVTDFLGDVQDRLLGLKDAFTVGDANKTEKALDTLRAGFNRGMGGAVGEVIDNETEAPLDRLQRRFEAVVEFFRTGFEKIGDAIGNLWQKFKDLMGNIKWDEVLAVVNTAFFGFLVYHLGRLISVIRDAVSFAGNAADAMQEFGKVLKAYARDINADALKRVAIAVAILAASIIALGLMPQDKLAKGAAAIAGVMAALTGMFLVMGGGGAKGKHAKGYLSPADMVKKSTSVLAMSGALVLLASAIAIIAGALAGLGLIPVDNLIQGSIAIAAILAALAAFMVGISFVEKFPGGMASAAAATIGIAVAMNILVGAVAMLGRLDPEVAENGLKRLGAIAAGVAVILVALGVMGPMSFGAAAVIVSITGMFIVLAGLVKLLGEIDDKGNLAQGLLALLAITAMVNAMLGVSALISLAGPGLLAVGAVMLSFASSVVLIAKAIEMLGKMDAGDGLQAVLIFELIVGTLIGALVALGTIMVSPIGVGIVALSGALWVLGLAILAAGTGVFLLATGLSILGTVGSAGIYVLLGAIESGLALIPIFFQQLALGIKGFVIIMIDMIPLWGEAMSKLLGAIIQAIRDNIPAGKDMLLELLGALREIITLEGPKWIQLAIDLAGDFFAGLAESETLRNMASAAVTFITGLLAAISSEKNVKKVVKSGGDLVLNFLDGVADWIEENTERIENTGRRIGDAMVDGVAAAFRGAFTSKAGKTGAFGIVGAIWGFVQDAKDEADAAADANSPAKRFIPVGKNMVDGVAVGMRQTEEIGKAARSFTQEAETAFTRALSAVADSVDANLDMSPTITPVMDMTAFESDAEKINSTLGDYARISPTVSYQAASNLARQESTTAEVAAANEPTVVNFEYVQQNTSPAALSTTEIYRQTKNQLSAVKRALEVI